MSRANESDLRLEAMLQEWATRHALPHSRSESIRLAVLQMPQQTPTELSVAWWQGFFGNLNSVLGRTTAMSNYLRFQQIA